MVQAVFSQSHYSRQVDPGNCSSDKVVSSTNCVVQFWVTFMMQFFGLKLTVNNWNDCLYLRKTNSCLSCSRQHALEILNTKVR